MSTEAERASETGEMKSRAAVSKSGYRSTNPATGQAEAWVCLKKQEDPRNSPFLRTGSDLLEAEVWAGSRTGDGGHLDRRHRAETEAADGNKALYV